MRNEADVNRALHLYANTVQRICFMHLNNRGDVEDVFQEVFLKYALHDAVFDGDAHERAWFIRVAVNACRDVTKSFWRRKVLALTETDEISFDIGAEHQEILDAVLRLKPPQYRNVIYLYYYEGYKAAEIAEILGSKENTIYTWLSRAKEQLKAALGGEQVGG